MMLSKSVSKIIGANRIELGLLSGNILSRNRRALPKTIMVTSSRAGEGRTTTAIAVAHALATETDARVLLVDADTEAPSIGTCFGLEATSGLSECITGEGAVGIAGTDQDRLYVLPAGESPAQSSRALASERMAQLLADWSEQYDHVVLDSSPVLTTSGPVLLAPHVDGILLVAECERTKWQVLETTQERLVGSGGNILGVILNKRRYYIPKLLYRSV
jgi:protein-tyrosine kinase